MKKLIGMGALLAVLCIATAMYNPLFLSSTNMQNLSRQVALLAILAIGEGIVILSGGIDLSVSSIICLSGLLVVYGCGTWGIHPVAMVGLVLVLCALVGLLHGVLITKLNLLAFIVTLCTMLFFRGLERGFTNDGTVGLGSDFPQFRFWGTGNWHGIPMPVIVLAVVAVICAFFLHYTKYGRYLFAIGRNDKAVAYSGINVPRMKTLAYMVSAMMAGVTGILYAAYTNSVQPASTGLGNDFFAVAAAVLGGCSMRAGEGTVVGIVIGAAILKTLTNSINLAGISTLWEYSVIGAVILVGVIVDTTVKKRAAERKARS